MIYLIDSGVTAYIPRVNNEVGDTIILENQTTHQVYSGTVVDYSFFYYSYSPDILLPDGQYTYQIVDGDGNVVEKGIAQSGDFQSDTTEYQMDKVKYTTYNYD